MTEIKSGSDSKEHKFYCFMLLIWLRSRAFVCFLSVWQSCISPINKRLYQRKENKHIHTWGLAKVTHTRIHTQTHIDKHKQWLQTVKATFFADDHPWITSSWRGGSGRLWLSPIFLCYFNSPLFWSRTYSADGGATDTGSRAAAATILARGMTPEIQPSGWQGTSSRWQADHKFKTSSRHTAQNTGDANIVLNV